MGRIRNFDIVVNDHRVSERINGVPVYRAGDHVAGVVNLTMNYRRNDVREITVKLLGKAKVKWVEFLSPSNENDLAFQRAIFNGSETYINEIISLWKQAPDQQILHTGPHAFGFDFQIPRVNLPTGFEGSCGSVRYMIKCEIVGESTLSYSKVKKVITVATHPLNLNSIQDVMRSPFSEFDCTVTRFCCLTTQIKTKLTADRRAYAAGETAHVSATVRSPISWRRFGVDIRLIQEVVYYGESSVVLRSTGLSGRRTKTCRRCRTFVERKNLTRMWRPVQGELETIVQGEPLLIPRDIQDTGFFGCNIIDIKYYISVVPNIAGIRVDTNNMLPIIVGRIPLVDQTQPAPPCYDEAIHHHTTPTEPPPSYYSSFVNPGYTSASTTSVSAISSRSGPTVPPPPVAHRASPGNAAPSAALAQRAIATSEGHGLVVGREATERQLPVQRTDRRGNVTPSAATLSTNENVTVIHSFSPDSGSHPPKIVDGSHAESLCPQLELRQVHPLMVSRLVERAHSEGNADSRGVETGDNRGAAEQTGRDDQMHADISPNRLADSSTVPEWNERTQLCTPHASNSQAPSHQRQGQMSPFPFPETRPWIDSRTRPRPSGNKLPLGVPLGDKDSPRCQQTSADIHSENESLESTRGAAVSPSSIEPCRAGSRVSAAAELRRSEGESRDNPERGFDGGGDNDLADSSTIHESDETTQLQLCSAPIPTESVDANSPSHHQQGRMSPYPFPETRPWVDSRTRPRPSENKSPLGVPLGGKDSPRCQQTSADIHSENESLERTREGAAVPASSIESFKHPSCHVSTAVELDVSGDKIGDEREHGGEDINEPEFTDGTMSTVNPPDPTRGLETRCDDPIHGGDGRSVVSVTVVAASARLGNVDLNTGLSTDTASSTDFTQTTNPDNQELQSELVLGIKPVLAVQTSNSQDSGTTPDSECSSFSRNFSDASNVDFDSEAGGWRESTIDSHQTAGGTPAEGVFEPEALDPLPLVSSLQGDDLVQGISDRSSCSGSNRENLSGDETGESIAAGHQAGPHEDQLPDTRRSPSGLQGALIHPADSPAQPLNLTPRTESPRVESPSCEERPIAHFSFPGIRAWTESRSPAPRPGENEPHSPGANGQNTVDRSLTRYNSHESVTFV